MEDMKIQDALDAAILKLLTDDGATIGEIATALEEMAMRYREQAGDEE